MSVDVNHVMLSDAIDFSENQVCGNNFFKRGKRISEYFEFLSQIIILFPQIGEEEILFNEFVYLPLYPLQFIKILIMFKQHLLGSLVLLHLLTSLGPLAYVI